MGLAAALEVVCPHVVLQVGVGVIEGRFNDGDEHLLAGGANGLQGTVLYNIHPADISAVRAHETAGAVWQAGWAARADALPSSRAVGVIVTRARNESLIGRVVREIPCIHGPDTRIIDRSGDRTLVQWHGRLDGQGVAHLAQGIELGNELADVGGQGDVHDVVDASRTDRSCAPALTSARSVSCVT